MLLSVVISSQIYMQTDASPCWRVIHAWIGKFELYNTFYSFSVLLKVGNYESCAKMMVEPYGMCHGVSLLSSPRKAGMKACTFNLASLFVGIWREETSVGVSPKQLTLLGE